MNYTAVIRKGEIKYIAYCPELDISSQGNTIEQAINNLKEAVELYIDEMGAPKKESETSIIASFEVKKHGKTSHSASI